MVNQRSLVGPLFMKGTAVRGVGFVLVSSEIACVLGILGHYLGCGSLLASPCHCSCHDLD